MYQARGYEVKVDDRYMTISWTNAKPQKGIRSGQP